jgi:type I restriction enzyme R subunit
MYNRFADDDFEDFKKLNKIKAIAFGERLQGIVQKYNERSEVDLLDYQKITD